ncbi:MAG: hypothetical protein SGILL_005057 [Bacillariaceae sp.]
MVSDANRTGLFVAVPVYFLILAGCAVWAYRRMEKMKHDGVQDKLSAHYLGGRDFGPWLIAGTMFATQYSGYTVIGIPNEAYRMGWFALRWMPTFAGIVWGYFGTGCRLRQASEIRNHQSPVDFITDRYQSQVLRYTVVFLQVLVSIIYLAAQVVAMKSTFNSIFELDPDTNCVVVIVMFLILMFEWVGGLSSIALTDAIQAIVMVASFVIVPIVIVKNFGGWKDLDPETYPRPEFYQTPSKEDQWSFWQFSIVNFSFFILPHFLQRIYAAKDLRSLKIGYTCLTIGPWVSGFVGVFIGTMGVTMLANEDGTPTDSANLFTDIIETMMDLGGFARGAGTIAITAGLAAIMSTTDSLIIAISQLVTVEVIYPMKPNATPTGVAWYGRITSLVAALIALLIGIFWNEGITDFGKIQFAIATQIVPVFLIGLYAHGRTSDAHPWCITAGAVAAFFYVVAIYFGYLKINPDAVPIQAGITGICLQFVVIYALEFARRLIGGGNNGDKVHTSDLLYPGRPEWDVPKLSRFGAHTLTPNLLWKSMVGRYEPMVNPSWSMFMFFSISVVTPLVAQLEPPLNPDGGEDVFLYTPAIVNGIPWWAFKIILLCVIPFATLLISVLKMPTSYHFDEKKISKKGVDPDLVPLTPEEMGRRTSYDAQNELVHRRRSSISHTMDDMGFSYPEGDSENSENANANPFAPSSVQKRLSALVTGHMLNIEEGEGGSTAKNEDAGISPSPSVEEEL